MSNQTTASEYPQYFLSGGGEMGALMRAHDWNATSLGDPGNWPKSLQVVLGIILHSRFPMFIWWGQDLLCFYNDAYRPSLGQDGKHPSILGVPAEKAWPEIWSTIQPLIQQVMQTGEAVWKEDQLIPIFRNGRLEDVYWTFSYSPINNDENKIGGVLVTCVETTNSILYQQQLQETNDLLIFSTEAALLGTWDYNPVTNQFKSNDRLKEWFGLQPENEIALSVAIDVIKKEDQERVKAAIAAATDFNRQVPYDIEYTIIHPHTKAERIVLARGKPYFNEHNEAYRFSGTLEDVTEQVLSRREIEAAEERARLAAAAGNLGLFDLDIVTNKTVVSPRLYEIYDVPHHAVREELLANISPEDRIVREEALRKAFETGTLFYEVRILRKDGTIHWVRAEGRIFYDDAGKARRLLGTVIDITDMKELEQKREEYIAIASHELRNPLTSLKLSLDLLALGGHEQKRELLLNKGRAQVKRIMTMTDELLSVSKIASGQLDLRPSFFNLAESIDESIANFKAGKDQNTFLVTGYSVITIKGDRFRIEQVLVNLLSNASKYSPENSTITIHVSQEHKMVKVAVTDTGIGIDTVQIPYIFKKFIRLASSNHIAGYGLGLYISEQIIRKHGGEMGLESEKGKGSTFWFTLPL